MSGEQNLDLRLRQRSGEVVGLAVALSNYLRSIQHAAGAAEVQLAHTVCDECSEQLKLTVQAESPLDVTWTPHRGWAFACVEAGQRQTYFRATEQLDAATVLPEPDAVVEWLHLLARGDRPGTRIPPQELGEASTALVDRLVTVGSYPGSYAPD